MRKLRAAGVISEDARVVCVLTGHILKDAEANHISANVREIEPTVEAVKQALA